MNPMASSPLGLGQRTSDHAKHHAEESTDDGCRQRRKEGAKLADHGEDDHEEGRGLHDAARANTCQADSTDIFRVGGRSVA